MGRSITEHLAVVLAEELCEVQEETQGWEGQTVY